MVKLDSWNVADEIVVARAKHERCDFLALRTLLHDTIRYGYAH